MRLLPASQTNFQSDRSLPYVDSLSAYLEISVRYKLLVMHRAFCGRKRAEQNDTIRSKAVCVDMARGLLMHCKSIVRQEDATMAVMWTTAYHAIAAAAVFALDMFALSANASASSVRRVEVKEAKAILSHLSSRSPIAVRGVTLLESLLRQFDAATRNAVMTPRVPEDPFPPTKKSKGVDATRTDKPSEWNWEDWNQYQSIVTMLQASPDVGRLFGGTLGNPFE